MHANVTMSRTAAAKLVDLMLKQASEQDRLLEELRDECSEEEFKRYCRMIGGTMASLFEEVMKPIFEIYPDLVPPQLRWPSSEEGR